MVFDASPLVAVGELLILFFFVVIGLTNLTSEGIRAAIGRMTELGLPFPVALFWIGNVLQFGGCTLILAGWHVDIGIYCLIFVTVTASALFHRFWVMHDEFRRATSQRMLLHNTAILGGLLLLLDEIK
jgi:uncharacterized membrane protein YphA (DoxX/SURF4 family)